MSNAEWPSLETRVADAIDLLHRVRFVARREPSALEKPTVDDVYYFSVQFDGTAGRELHLRRFQKAGISSALVAQAVRAGVLGVVEVST